MQQRIEELKQKVAVTTKATRPFVCNQAAAPEEETQRKITLAATSECGKRDFLTPLAPEEYGDVDFAAWNNKIDQARTYCRI